jgi:hypothetical protein
MRLRSLFISAALGVAASAVQAQTGLLYQLDDSAVDGAGTGKLYVVAADYTIGKPDAQGNVPDEVYPPNTFVVPTYQPV